MLAIRLPQNIEKRLAYLADATGRTKTFYAREAIVAYIEDLEDIYISSQRLKKPGKCYLQSEVEKMLGLED